MNSTTATSTLHSPAAWLQRISFYKRLLTRPPHSVHVVVKPRPGVLEPCFFDTYFYSVPVRSSHGSEYSNMVLGFACPSQARTFAESLNDDTECMFKLRNNQEPQKPADTREVGYETMAYDAHMLGMPLVVVSNSFCANQMEPFFEVYIEPPTQVADAVGR